MPHLVILYSGNLEAPIDEGGTDVGALCRTLADTMLGVRDDDGKQVFPTAGTRVLAYPAAHHAVADGSRAQLNSDGPSGFAFVYLNLRMGRGRSEAVHQRIGAALVNAARAHFALLLETRLVGITLQIDVGAEVFDAKFGNLHAHFDRKG